MAEHLLTQASSRRRSYRRLSELGILCLALAVLALPVDYTLYGQSVIDIRPSSPAPVIELGLGTSDVAYLGGSAEAEIRIPSLPGHVWRENITKMRRDGPHSDAEYVVVVWMRDPHRLLKPSMTAHARLVGEKRPLGWVVIQEIRRRLPV